MTGLVLAFMTGTALSAMFGNVIEGHTGKPARFTAPSGSHHNIVKSLLMIAVAGPYMLVEEAIAVGASRGAKSVLVYIAMSFAALWSLAAGIVWLEFFFHVAQGW